MKRVFITLLLVSLFLAACGQAATAPTVDVAPAVADRAQLSVSEYSDTSVRIFDRQVLLLNGIPHTLAEVETMRSIKADFDALLPPDLFITYHAKVSEAMSWIIRAIESSTDGDFETGIVYLNISSELMDEAILLLK